MLFNSFAFAVFLPIVFLAYWCLPHRFRWVLLLIASYYFYMSWNAKYVVLILFTTAISYGAARLLENEKSERKRKLYLAGTAVLCLSVLFFFKYFNFFSESVAAFLRVFAIEMNPVTLQLLLPVGISFYTFQTLSYVIDVYKGEVPAEHHFGYYAAFISFFPQLVAGPIERTSNLLPQIKAKHDFDYHQATYGLKLMAWGFFKKLCVADAIAVYVDAIYASLDANTGFALLFAVFGFTIQIYCDFSGYSDIAIGTAKLMGINLMTNFKSPYFASSIKEFWSRWHISLSSWFRDYVYIPLGGNRCGRMRHAVNLMITFLVSGLWHGANWTFVIWGGIHGAAQIVENALSKYFKKIKDNKVGYILSVLLTFLFCSFAWIFFRAESCGDAFFIIGHMFDRISEGRHYFSNAIGLGNDPCVRIACMVLLLAVYDYFSLKTDVIEWIGSKHWTFRWLVYSVMVMLLFLFSQIGSHSFLYFQF